MRLSWRLHRTLCAALLSLLVAPSILVGAPAVAADPSVAGPVMRLTPVRPPHGQPPYPHGTRIEGQKIILPHGDVHVWFELQIENWASLGSLRSYSGAIAPYWPWP